MGVRSSVLNMTNLRYLLDTQEEMLSRQLRYVSLELREV